MTFCFNNRVEELEISTDMELRRALSDRDALQPFPPGVVGKQAKVSTRRKQKDIKKGSADKPLLIKVISSFLIKRSESPPGYSTW